MTGKDRNYENQRKQNKKYSFKIDVNGTQNGKQSQCGFGKRTGKAGAALLAVLMIPVVSLEAFAGNSIPDSSQNVYTVNLSVSPQNVYAASSLSVSPQNVYAASSLSGTSQNVYAASSLSGTSQNVLAVSGLLEEDTSLLSSAAGRFTITSNVRDILQQSGGAVSAPYSAKLSFLYPLRDPSGSDNLDDLTGQREETQSELDAVTSTIEELASAQEEIEEEIEEISCALVQVMAEIEVVKQDISAKEDEIEVAAQEYADAVETERQQYEAMKIRIKYLYESGNPDLMSIYMETGSISETLVKADYIEDLYEYDRNMLGVYQETVTEVAELQAALEQEYAELQSLQEEYESQQSEMEAVMSELAAVSEDYDTQIAAAEKEAAVYAKKLEEQNAAIKKIEEERKKAAEEAARKAAEEAAKKAAEEAAKKAAEEAAAKAAEDAAKAQEEQAAADAAAETTAQLEAEEEKKNEETRQEAVDSVADTQTTGTVTTTSNSKYDVSSIYAASGSDLGKSIAVYACQFIGNPYVAGGTSLTNGADCSGFIYTVYKDFGYTVPRNSYSLRSAGTEVSYSNAQPGDIICYTGHVALYIGNGMIVHASTEKSGIKVSNAQYREILTVRRIVK